MTNNSEGVEEGPCGAFKPKDLAKFLLISKKKKNTIFFLIKNLTSNVSNHKYKKGKLLLSIFLSLYYITLIFQKIAIHKK